jgi:hypothetical protein
MALHANSFWPNATQTALLGVCLHRDPGAAIASWKEWKARVDLDDLDKPSFQIMSIVYHRFLELGIADPDLPRIKGLHRYRWTQEQLVSRGKRELLKALHAENIPAIILKGSALSQTVYPNTAARGSRDMEIVAPPALASRAIAALEARGWIARQFDPARATDLSCPLLHPEYGEVVLQWHILRSRSPAGREEELWQAARPLECEGTPASILCPADQLLYLCEYGIYPYYPSGVQWLVDCTFVIRRAAAPFDWARLIDQSRKFQLSLHTHETMAFLCGHFEDSIPAEVVAELARLPVPLDNRIEYFVAGRPAEKQHDMMHKFGMAACRYLRLKQGGRVRQFLQDVPRFVRLLSRRPRQRVHP